MKKVICVEHTPGDGLTPGNPYVPTKITDFETTVINDNKFERSYPHTYFKNPVPEQEFQYGQEVELFGGSEKVVFCCIDPDFPNIAIIKRYDMMLTKVDRVSLSDIRPVQSMREKVIEEIQMALPPIKGDRTAEVIADRIIELVKNEKI